MYLQSVYPLVYVAIIWHALYQFHFVLHLSKSHFLNPKMILFHFWCKINPTENGTRKCAIIAQWKSIKTTPDFEYDIPIADGQYLTLSSKHQETKEIIIYVQCSNSKLILATHCTVIVQRIARPFTTNCTSIYNKLHVQCNKLHVHHTLHVHK